ncbi:hypothetical protein F8S13_22275 [Chloroflexia bacterium SDU3-3]|nr:hypothetical protein F8S13_22275 [Chloroflexia bacterium SDU3-3]
MRQTPDLREPARAADAPPALMWPICRAVPLMDGQLLELIASNLGPIGVFIRGQFAGQLSPDQLRQLGERALSLADDLEADRAARRWSEELRANGRS